MQLKKKFGFKNKLWTNDEDIRTLPNKTKRGQICGLEDLCWPF